MKEDTGGLKGPSPTPQVKAALIHSAAVAAANKVAYSRESPLLQAACTAAGGKNSPLLIDPTLLKQSPASSQPPPVVPTANYNEINIHSLTGFVFNDFYQLPYFFLF
jgi:hypothetical protein